MTEWLYILLVHNNEVVLHHLLLNTENKLAGISVIRFSHAYTEGKHGYLGIFTDEKTERFKL